MRSEHWAYAYRRVAGQFVIASQRQTIRAGEAIRWAAEGAARDGGGMAFRIVRDRQGPMLILCRFGDVPDDAAALTAGMQASIDCPSEGAAACGP